MTEITLAHVVVSGALGILVSLGTIYQMWVRPFHRAAVDTAVWRRTISDTVERHDESLRKGEEKFDNLIAEIQALKLEQVRTNALLEQMNATMSSSVWKGIATE